MQCLLAPLSLILTLTRQPVPLEYKHNNGEIDHHVGDETDHCSDDDNAKEKGVPLQSECKMIKEFSPLKLKQMISIIDAGQTNKMDLAEA